MSVEIGTELRVKLYITKCMCANAGAFVVNSEICRIIDIRDGGHVL